MEKAARETHAGVKFRTEFLSKAVSADPRLQELKAWCAEFHRRNFAPPYGEFSQGNLSFRLAPGQDAFVITGSQVGWKDRLTDDRFVTVRGCDLNRRIVYAEGDWDPSSESMMHYAIYRARADVGAVFHGHSRELLKSGLSLPQTIETAPYGSLELVNRVLEVLDAHCFLLIRKHGFLSLGRTMKEAGELAIDTHNLCLSTKAGEHDKALL